MKDLLSKERYCYKIHILLMKRIAYTSFLQTIPLYGLHPQLPRSPLPPPPLPPAPFLQKNLDPLFHDFSKIPNHGGLSNHNGLSSVS